MPQALVLIDLINELIAPEGKLSGKGYTDFAQRPTPPRAGLQNCWPMRTVREISSYMHASASHPITGSNPRARLCSNTPQNLFGDWGTQFLPQAAPLPGETVLTKHRVNAFFGTPLNLILRNAGMDRVAIVGCSTDVGMQTTARAAHDLDYQVTVIGDCCIAPSDEDHRPTLRMLTKVVRITSLEQFMNP